MRPLCKVLSESRLIVFTAIYFFIFDAIGSDDPVQVTATYIGTATVLLEIGSKKPLRILTDPALDGPGKRYNFKFGTSGKKLMGPAVSVDQLPPIDLVLLSHDQHGDNLDDAGRAVLPRARQVFTTRSGAHRLNEALGEKVVGFDPWDKETIISAEGIAVSITAVPAKHGQTPLPECIVGETTGFIIEWPEQTKGGIYISGDTVFFSGIREISRRFKINTAFLHNGSAKFPISGPLRYTFNASAAVKAAKVLDATHVIPIHFEGWSHFSEGLEDLRASFVKSGVSERLMLLPPGVKTVLHF